MTTLDQLLTALQLHHAAAVVPAWLDRAAQQELSYADFLVGVLEEEVSADHGGHPAASAPGRLPVCRHD